LIDRIEGGARRGSNLFHSFFEFNVNSGQQVYFANPANISNIIGRVTGGNLSRIEGLLGVSGNANLFLINPNGIVFGSGARLDIRGSFFASTSDRIVFPDGYAYSTTNPDSPPLLTVNAPLGLASWLPNAGTIASTGNLSVGQDLVLAGANLDLQGQLQAGSNLTLTGIDSLIIRNSRLSSGGDLVLRSNNPVNGDGRFFAGGNFRVEQIDGNLGSLTTLQDAVFETGGNFSIADYTGASLQILAGGSVTIPGTITIIGAGGAFNDSVISLSDGTNLAINGTIQPTVDIRAGISQFSGISAASNLVNSAQITLGNIINPGGLVFVSNQLQPNQNLGSISLESINTTTDPAMGIDGGSVAIDSRGQITFQNIDVSGGDRTTFSVGGNGGDVTILARNDIFMPSLSSIYSFGLRGGNITLKSDTAIIQEGAPLNLDRSVFSQIENDTFDSVQGGDIQLTAPSIILGGNIFASNEGEGRSGNIIITTDSLLSDQAWINTQTFGPGDAGDTRIFARSFTANPNSLIGSATFSANGGNGGNVLIESQTLAILGGAQIASATLGVGNAGDLNINAENITVSGFLTPDLAASLGGYAPSAIFSTAQPGAVGNSGKITINTSRLTITNGGLVGTTAFGIGNAGDININASDSINVDGAVYLDYLNRSEPSAISSELQDPAIGKSGNIQITAPILQVTNGGTITAVSNADGDAGAILIDATNSILVDGVTTFAGQPARNNRISQIAVFTTDIATGNGGNLTLNTPFLTLTNGGQLTAKTDGVGNAGNLQVNVEDSLILDGFGSGILANTSPGSRGNGGSVFVNADQVSLSDRARISVDSQGTGTAGDIFLEANSLTLDRQSSILAETLSNTGGNITLQTNDFISLRRNSRISTSAGTARAGGDGGNVTLRTNILVALPTENSDITANAFTGRGGRVDITAQGIFGFTVLSRSELEQLLGTNDPTRLNPALLPSSDITAISQVNPDLNGEVILRTPGLDPNQEVVNFPSTVVDTSQLIARNCSAGGTLAQSRGSLVVTGRGGLPPSPREPLTGDTVLVGWQSPDRSNQPSNQAINPPPVPSPVQLVEVQALARRPDGQVILVAKSPETASQNFGNRSPFCPQ
jgi:filamentous hemagglutinin family protein